MIRWAFKTLVLLGFAMSATRAFANPIPDAAVKRLNALPFLIVQNPTPAEKEEFRQQLLRYDPDEYLLYEKRTRDLFDNNYARFKSYFLESQRPGARLNRGIQARIRSRGTSSDRKQMITYLRGWLKGVGPQPANLKPAHPDTNFANRGMLKVVELAHNYPEWQVAGAAECLADWQDRLALSRIDSLAADSSMSEATRMSLKVSAQRLREPCSSGFLVPDGHGGLRVCRTESDLASMKFVSPRVNEPICTDLSPAKVHELWSLIVSPSREGIHARWFDDGANIRMTFKDGLVATLSPTESGWFNYNDSNHDMMWSRVIENPSLFQAVKDCLPARALPR